MGTSLGGQRQNVVAFSRAPQAAAPQRPATSRILMTCAFTCAPTSTGRDRPNNLNGSAAGAGGDCCAACPVAPAAAPRQWSSSPRGAALWDRMAPVSPARPRSTQPAFRLHSPWVGNRAGSARPRDVQGNSWPNAVARAPVQRGQRRRRAWGRARARGLACRRARTGSARRRTAQRRFPREALERPSFLGARLVYCGGSSHAGLGGRKRNYEDKKRDDCG